MNSTDKLKERQEEMRKEYRKNAITVPMYKKDRERIEAAAKRLGITRTGFLRMAANKYIVEMGID